MDYGMDAVNIGASLGRQLMGTIGAQEAGYTKMAKLLADTSLKQAQGDYFKQKANSERQRAQYQTPEYGSRIAASLAGLSDPQAVEMDAYAKNGNWGMTPARDDPVQQMTLAPTPKTAPEWVTPDVRAKYDAARAVQAMNLGATGNSTVNQMAEAQGKILEQGRKSDALNGRITPEMARGLNGLEAAEKGSLYSFHEFGTGDQATGGVNFNQPYLDKNASTIAQNRAQAANALASAGQHGAQTEAVRLKMSQPQVIVGQDGTTTILDPKTGLPTGTPKPTGEYLKQQTGVKNVQQAITDYRNALAGWDKGKMLSPDARAELGTYYNNMLLQAKEAYNLGVLNGPDYQILQEVVANPNSFATSLISKQALDKQASNLDDLMGRIGQNSSAVHRQPMPGEVTTARLVDRSSAAKPTSAPRMSQDDARVSVLKARKAIADGRDKAAIIQMLEEAGITSHGIQ